MEGPAGRVSVRDAGSGELEPRPQSPPRVGEKGTGSGEGGRGKWEKGTGGEFSY